MLIFSRVPALSRLGFLIVFILSFSVVQGQDSVSLNTKLILLEDRIKDLENDLEERVVVLRQLQNEKLVQYQLTYEKMEDKLENFMWTISIIVGLVGLVLTFLGLKAIQSSVEKYFDKEARKIIKDKINSELTEDWFKQEVEERTKPQVKLAINEFHTTINNMIEGGKSKIKKYDDEVRTAVLSFKAEVKKKREELDRMKLKDRASELNEEERQKVIEYEEVLEKSKDFDEFTEDDWFWKGRAESARGEYKESIESYTQAIRLNPQYDVAWNNRGAAKNSLSLYQEAIEDCNEAIRLNPQLKAAWNNRGLAKSSLGLYQEAIEDLDEALRLNPQNDAAWNNRGLAKNKLGLYQEAIEDLDEALRLNPELPNAYAHRAYSYLMLDQLEKAEEDIVKSQSLDNTYPRGWYYLGLIRQKQNRMKEACKAWKKAVELGYKEAQEKLDEFCKES